MIDSSVMKILLVIARKFYQPSGYTATDAKSLQNPPLERPRPESNPERASKVRRGGSYVVKIATRACP